MSLGNDRPVVNGSAAMADSPAGAAAGGSEVDRAVEEYLALLETGERPDRQAFLTRYAGLGPALSKCLEALDFLRAAGPRLSDVGDALPDCAGAELPERLGDF